MTPDLEQLISDLMYDDEYLSYIEAKEIAVKILETWKMIDMYLGKPIEFWIDVKTILDSNRIDTPDQLDELFKTNYQQYLDMRETIARLEHKLKMIGELCGTK